MLTVMPAPEKTSALPEVKFVPVAVMVMVEPAAPEALSSLLSVGLFATEPAVKVTALVVVVPLVTVTLRGPAAAAALMRNRAVICVGLTTFGLRAVTPLPETETVLPAVKRVPVNVTVIMVLLDPFAGLMAVRVGPEVEVTVKIAGAVVRPPEVTVMFRAPDAAVASTTKFAVIWVALTTVGVLTVTPGPSTAIVDPLPKFVPVRVTLEVVPLAALDGVSRAKVGAATTVNVAPVLLAVP